MKQLRQDEKYSYVVVQHVR